MRSFLRTFALAAALFSICGPALAGDGKGPEVPVPPPAVEPAEPAPAPQDEAKPSAAPRQEAAQQGAALLQMFQTFCRQTHAGAGAVIAAAERDGYTAANDDDLKAFAGIDLRDLQVRIKTVDGVRRIVGSAHGSSERVEGRPAMDVCIVSISPGGADIEPFGRWVGVEPMASAPGARSVFMFLEGPRGRQSIGDAGTPGELRRRMRDGDLQLLMVGDEGDATLAIYGVMRPEI
jgi:hypothetical protein